MVNTMEAKIIQALLQEKEPITSEQLAKSLHVSSRTVRNYLSPLKNILPKHGALLITQQGVGIQLLLQDEEAFQSFLKLQNAHAPRSPQDRLVYLLNLMIFQDEYQKTFYLSAILYISIQQLNRDLQQLKQILHSYQLKLVSKHGVGIRIEGDESQKRRCAMETIYFDNVDFLTNETEEFTELENILMDVFTSESVMVADAGIKSLTIHLLIAILRIQSDNYIFMDQETIKTIVAKSEFKIMQKINNELNVRQQIALPISELCYLAQHLMGKKEYVVSEGEYNRHITPQVQYLVNLFLREVLDVTKIDFYGDKDLKANLLLHMIPFIKRMENGSVFRNPIIDDVKQKYAKAFQLASIGLSKVAVALNKKISEDEISYFAIHLVLALERLKENTKPKNIVIACSMGKATSQLLAYQIKKQFSSYINNIKIISVYALKSENLSSYDCIFSTVDIHDDHILIPIIVISPLMENKDIQLIEQTLKITKTREDLKSIFDSQLFFTGIKAETKAEAVQSILDKLKEKRTLTDDYYELIMQRENLVSTEIGNYTALPHTMLPVDSETFIAIGILDKPVLWGQTNVQLIFLISIAENNDTDMKKFFSYLMKFTSDENKVLSVIKESSFDFLINVFFGLTPS